MRLLAFALIVTCAASIWAGFGMLEVLAYVNDVLVTFAAAAFVSHIEEE